MSSKMKKKSLYLLTQQRSWIIKSSFKKTALSFVVRDEPDVCVEWSSQINKAAVLMRDSVPAEDLTV